MFHDRSTAPSGAWQYRGEALRDAPAATSGPWDEEFIGKRLGKTEKHRGNGLEMASNNQRNWKQLVKLRSQWNLEFCPAIWVELKLEHDPKKIMESSLDNKLGLNQHD